MLRFLFVFFNSVTLHVLCFILTFGKTSSAGPHKCDANIYAAEGGIIYTRLRERSINRLKRKKNTKKAQIRIPCKNSGLKNCFKHFF